MVFHTGNKHVTYPKQNIKGDIYMTYFCFYHQLQLKLESQVHAAYTS